MGITFSVYLDGAGIEKSVGELAEYLKRLVVIYEE